MICLQEKIDLPSFLASQDLLPKFYYKCPKTEEERVALGSLLTTNTIPTYLDQRPDLCFYGGLSFAKKPFFFLPQIEIRQTKNETRIISKSPVSFSHAPSYGSLHLKRESDLPEKNNWIKSVNLILDEIKKGALQKIVAARKTTFTLNASPFLVLDKLAKTSLLTKTFALQLDQESLFLGSSPERLYHRKNNLLTSEAIAGTRKRGLTKQEDETLAKDLLSGIKELTEFSYVKDFLTEKFSFLCENFLTDQSDSLIQTNHVQHLYHAFQGTLKPRIQDKDILLHLHPTPAVGGVPYEKALSFIDSLEDFSRGLYAGSIGWLSKEEASFTVAIRSALIENNKLHAFAGAGIVKGSDPEKEWDELEQKIAHWTYLCQT